MSNLKTKLRVNHADNVKFKSVRAMEKLTSYSDLFATQILEFESFMTATLYADVNESKLIDEETATKLLNKFDELKLSIFDFDDVAMEILRANLLIRD